MQDQKVIVRPEKPEDTALIRTVHDEAFERRQEGRLVDNLRKSGEFIPELSLVAEYDGRVAGHILFYPVEILDDDDAVHKVLALAPLAVLPVYQNIGIGSELVKAGLDHARQLGFSAVIVLGHPRYYPRFGFYHASRWHIYPPFDVSGSHFMAVELHPGGLKGVQGTVQYPPAFDDV